MEVKVIWGNQRSDWEKFVSTLLPEGGLALKCIS